MTRLIGRAWVPMVVVAVGAFAVSQLRGVSRSYMSVLDFGTADLIIRFEPKRVICEIYGAAGRAPARALRCWSQPTRDARDRRVTHRKVFR
jgi:hypothetical protein